MVTMIRNLFRWNELRELTPEPKRAYKYRILENRNELGDTKFVPQYLYSYGGGAWLGGWQNLSKNLHGIPVSLYCDTMEEAVAAIEKEKAKNEYFAKSRMETHKVHYYE